MSVKTPQTVRSLLRVIPSRFIASASPRLGGGFVCTQCRYRGSSALSNNNDALKHIRSPLVRNGQWVRQWSSSIARKAAGDKDKPEYSVFAMPPPENHTEERAPDSTSASSPPPSQELERKPDSVDIPPPSETTEKVSDSIPDIPPTRPFPVEGSSDPKLQEQPEETTTSYDPIHTPAPKSKAAAPEDVSSATTLPSETAARRWQLSEKTQKHMDDFLTKAAIFSQRLNNYTGTDYSGIEALRREIIEQGRQALSLSPSSFFCSA